MSGDIRKNSHFKSAKIQIIKRWSEAESFTILENHAYSRYKNLTFARNFVNLAPKLIQHVIAIGLIKNLDTGSYLAINFVTNLAPKLIQHVIAIGSIKNLDTGSYLAINFVTNLAPKVIQMQQLVNSYLLNYYSLNDLNKAEATICAQIGRGRGVSWGARKYSSQSHKIGNHINILNMKETIRMSKKILQKIICLNKKYVN